MITNTLAVCAEGILIDSITNSVSIFKVLDELAVQGYPVLVARLECLFILTRDQDDVQQPDCRLTVSHYENSLHDSAVNVDFGDGIRTRVIVRLQGLVIPGPGIIKFSLKFDDDELGAWGIAARQVDGPQMEQVDAGP